MEIEKILNQIQPPPGVSSLPSEILSNPMDIREFIGKYIFIAVSTSNGYGELQLLGSETVKDMPYYLNHLGLTEEFNTNIDHLIRGNVISADTLPYSLRYSQVACLFYDTWYFELFRSIEELSYNIEIMFNNGVNAIDLDISDFTVLVGNVCSKRMFDTLLRMAKSVKTREV